MDHVPLKDRKEITHLRAENEFLYQKVKDREADLDYVTKHVDEMISELMSIPDTSSAAEFRDCILAATSRFLSTVSKEPVFRG